MDALFLPLSLSLHLGDGSWTEEPRSGFRPTTPRHATPAPPRSRSSVAPFCRYVYSCTARAPAVGSTGQEGLKGLLRQLLPLRGPQGRCWLLFCLLLLASAHPCDHHYSLFYLPPKDRITGRQRPKDEDERRRRGALLLKTKTKTRAGGWSARAESPDAGGPS